MAKKQKNLTSEKIHEITKGIYEDISRKTAPLMQFPIRSLTNVAYDAKSGFFKILSKTKRKNSSNDIRKTKRQNSLKF